MAFLFNLLVFLLPLTFVPLTSEIFEFNKIVLVYGFTILIVATWVFESIKQEKIIFKHTPLTVPILIFLSSQIISTVFSIDIRTSIFGYYGRFNGGLLSTVCYSVLYFAFVSFMDKEKTLNIFKTLIISSTIATVYAFLEHFGYSPSCLIITGSFDTNCFVQDVQERVFGTFGQPNWLAAYLTSLAPLIWNKAINTKNKRPFYLLLSALFFTTLLFTKSRSGLLGFGVASIVFWLFTLKLNFKKHIKGFVILNLVFLVLFLLFNPIGKNTSPNESAQNIASDNLGGTESGVIRKIVWKGAFDLWMKYPLAGTGVETFAFSYYETRPLSHNNTSEWNHLYNKAHNEYLNFAATTGTVGLAGYALLIISALSIFYKNIKNIFDIALSAGFISLLVTNFFGFSTVTTFILFFLLPAMAVCLNISKLKKVKTKTPDHINVLVISIIMIFFQIGLIKYWLADYFYAKGNIEEAIKLSPDEPLYKIEQAKRYVETEELKLAEEELEFVKKSSPRNIKILKEIANIYGDLGQHNKFYFLNEQLQLQEIVKLAPTDVQAKYQLALSHGKLGNIEKSKEVVLEAVEMKPDYKLARKYLANIYLAQGDLQKAKDEYEYILKYISPEDTEIKNSLDNLK